jgi:hypothetical protein
VKTSLRPLSRISFPNALACSAVIIFSFMASVR